MVVHDQAVWILMGACSLAAVAYTLRARLRAASGSYATSASDDA